MDSHRAYERYVEGKQTPGLAFIQTTFLRSCLTCRCVHDFPILWLIWAPVPSLSTTHLPAFVTPRQELKILTLLLPAQKNGLSPEMLASQTVIRARDSIFEISLGSEMHAQCPIILTLNAAASPLSLGTKEKSKDPSGTCPQTSWKSQMGVWPTQLSAAETKAPAPRWGSISIRETSHVGATVLYPGTHRLPWLPSSPRTVLSDKMLKQQQKQWVAQGGRIIAQYKS